MCRTSDLTPSLTIWSALTEASLEGALTDGWLLLESCRHWASSSSWIATQWIPLATVRGVQWNHRWKHSLRNLQGSCRLLPRQRPKSVLQFESDRVFDQQNSESVSQNAGYKPSNVLGWLRVRVQSELADRTQVVCRDTSGSDEIPSLQKLLQIWRGADLLFSN